MWTANGFSRQRVKWTLVTLLLLASLLASSAQAEPRLQTMPPALPASYWGTVTINGAFVPAGTELAIGSGGIIYATALSTIYEGSAYYRLNVPEDDPETPERDGGQPDEVLEITVAGLRADQTVIWQSGLNQRVDLTASSVSPTVPTATATPSPTSEPTSTPTPTPTVTPTVRPGNYAFLPLVRKR